jgi:hypothetical protein
MPKYFITSDDGSGPRQEPEPVDFPCEKAATDDAQSSLADIAGEMLPDGRHAAFSIRLTDEAGVEVYRASLQFDASTGEETRAAAAKDAQEGDAAADSVAALIKRR